MNFFEKLFKYGSVKKNKDIISLEKKIKYRFSNLHYLLVALTHRSLHSDPQENYERLEFLGDAVLDHVVSEWLYNKYSTSDEGTLTKKRASLVNRNFLAMLGQDFGLVKHVNVDSGVDLTDTKVIKNISADIYESIVGAIFLDGGDDAAASFIHRTLIHNEEMSDENLNYKGNLIELCHKLGMESPVFQLEQSKGPEHNKVFMVKTILSNGDTYSGMGSSKKIAEQHAAKNAIHSISPPYSSV